MKVEIVPNNVSVILPNGLNGLNAHTRVVLVLLQELERFSLKTKHAMILWKNPNLVIKAAVQLMENGLRGHLGANVLFHAILDWEEEHVSVVLQSQIVKVYLVLETTLISSHAMSSHAVNIELLMKYLFLNL